jgi:hypothetical protein
MHFESLVAMCAVEEHAGGGVEAAAVDYSRGGDVADAIRIEAYAGALARPRFRRSTA